MATPKNETSQMQVPALSDQGHASRLLDGVLALDVKTRGFRIQELSRLSGCCLSHIPLSGCCISHIRCMYPYVTSVFFSPLTVPCIRSISLGTKRWATGWPREVRRTPDPQRIFAQTKWRSRRMSDTALYEEEPLAGAQVLRFAVCRCLT